MVFILLEQISRGVSELEEVSVVLGSHARFKGKSHFVFSLSFVNMQWSKPRIWTPTKSTLRWGTLV
jgi:hypothetical protein